MQPSCQFCKICADINICKVIGLYKTYTPTTGTLIVAAVRGDIVLEPGKITTNNICKTHHNNKYVFFYNL